MKKGRANRPPPFASFSSITSSSPDLVIHEQESSSSLIEGNETESGYPSSPSPDYEYGSKRARADSSSTSPALATGLSRHFAAPPFESDSMQTATQSAFPNSHLSRSPPAQSPPYPHARSYSHSNQPYESASSHHLSPSHSSSVSPGLSLVSPYSPPVPLSPPQPGTTSHIRTTSNPHLRQLPTPPQQLPQVRSPPPGSQHQRYHSGSPTNQPIDPDSPSNLLPPSVRSAGYNPFQPAEYQNGEQGQGYVNNTSPGSAARYGGYGEGMDALAVLEMPDDFGR